MKHYWFEIIDGEYEGEEFLVEASSLKQARKIVRDTIEGNCKYVCQVSDEEAEMSGLDEY